MIYKEDDSIINLNILKEITTDIDIIMDFFNTIIETLDNHLSTIKAGIETKKHKKIYYGAHTMKGLSSLGIIAIVNICADFINLTEEVKLINNPILYIQKFEIYKKYYDILEKEIVRFKNYVKNFSEKDINI